MNTRTRHEEETASRSSVVVSKRRSEARTFGEFCVSKSSASTSVSSFHFPTQKVSEEDPVSSPQSDLTVFRGKSGAIIVIIISIHSDISVSQ